MTVKEFKVDTAVPQVSSEKPELVINNGVSEKAEVQISDKGSGVKKDTVQVYRNGQAVPCEVIEKNGALVCTFDVDKGGIYTVNAMDEAGNSVEYTVTANARNAQVNNTEGIFGTVDLDHLLAAVDLSGYTNGETATLTLSLSAREASDVSSALKEKFISLVRSDSKLYVFDVSLLLKVETPDGFVTVENISMTDNKVDIILTIPEGIRGKYNYKVLRCHENQCDVISSRMDKGGTAITFGTDRFSEYALSYTDASKVPKPDNKKPGSTGAKTGDEAPIVWLFLITIVTTGIIATILFQMKKYRHR